MKPTFFFLVCILTYTASFGQTKTPTKTSNVIYVQSEDPEDVIYKNVGKLLLTEGFSLDKTNDTFHTVSTKPLYRGNYAFGLVLEISIVDNLAIIKGSSISSPYKFPITYDKGQRISKLGFAMADEYAKKLATVLASGEITYDTK